jgi:putative transposase
MPTGLVRYQQTGHLHFITSSCFRHRQLLGTPQARDTFQQILEQTRKKYAVEIHGYVLMPDHIHLLLSEPEQTKLSTVMQVLKQRFSRTCKEKEVWEVRYHDANIKTQQARIEVLHYIHHNPVKRDLVSSPEAWPWSSYLAYTTESPHPVQITQS